MLRNLLLLTLTFFGQLLMAQPQSRELLRGQIIGETNAGLEGVTLYNKNTNKGAVTDEQGFFNLMARANDTLMVSSINMKEARVVLNPQDFLLNVYVVRLESNINELSEVVITPNALTGDLVKDSRNLKYTSLDSGVDLSDALQTRFEADEQTSPRNAAMPNDGSIPLGMDFVAIGKMVGGLFKKPKPENYKYSNDRDFQRMVKERFTYHFFTETLGLETNEIGLFLAQCENDPQVKELLKPQREIDLIDFLIKKSEDYQATKP